jgi:hypothetical protein
MAAALVPPPEKVRTTRSSSDRDGELSPTRICSKTSSAWSSSEFNWTVAQPLAIKRQATLVTKLMNRFLKLLAFKTVSPFDFRIKIGVYPIIYAFCLKLKEKCPAELSLTLLQVITGPDIYFSYRIAQGI